MLLTVNELLPLLVIVSVRVGVDPTSTLLKLRLPVTPIRRGSGLPTMVSVNVCWAVTLRASRT